MARKHDSQHTGGGISDTVTHALEVIRVRTRQTLAKPEIAQLVLRGARACGFPVPGAVLADLLLEVGDERYGVFLGLANDAPRGIVVAQLPLSAFMTDPVVVLAYSEQAPAELVRLVAEKLAKWIAKAGFERALALNMRHTDRAFCRGLAHFGVSSRVGGVIAFALKEGERG